MPHNETKTIEFFGIFHCCSCIYSSLRLSFRIKQRKNNDNDNDNENHW